MTLPTAGLEPPPLRVDLSALTSGAEGELATRWQALEARADPTFFLRWAWIGTWLEEARPEGLLAEVRLGERLVALGIFARRGRTLWLHQTGKDDEDQTWIEYNGLLAEAGLEAPALAAVTRALLGGGACGQVHLSMLPESWASDLLQLLPHARVYQKVTGWQRDLSALRHRGDSILAALSSNTRQQVRRSLRGFETRYGERRVARITSAHAALSAFYEAGCWHRERWHDSGFTNPRFTAFHESLLKRAIDHGQARIYRVAFGDHTAGIFYFLCDGRNARFYLQGVQPESDGKLKPGLTGHCLLMQHFLDEGWDCYDLMGGDSRYKRQLADRPVTFLTLRAHDGSPVARARDAARRLRNAIRSPD